MSDDTGFLDNWEKKDDDEDEATPAEPEIKTEPRTNVWGEPITPIDSTGMDMTELEAMEAERESQEAAKAATVVRPPTTPTGPSPALPNGDWMAPSSNPAWREIHAARLRAAFDGHYVLMGMAGPPKCGKTGVVLDSLTPEEIEAGAEIWHIDFDLGGETTKAAHHSDKADNIVILNPWVIDQNPSRVPYNFPASYQRAIDHLLAAIEMVDSQMAYYAQHGKLPKPYLKTVCFDGADHWLNICETVMKVDDLKLGPDGIAVAGKDATTKIGRFNWNIRKNRNNAALTALQELCRRGVHCYVITHMKTAYDGSGNEIIGAETPHWLKETEGWLQQVAMFEVDEERDERGELTGVVNAYAVMTQNRTSLKSSGKVNVFRRDKEGGEWFGWPGLRDGSFSHPDDRIVE